MVGRHDRITSQTGKTASLTGFIKTFETCSTIPIINADTVYDCEIMGRSIILSIHNGLYFKGMNHNLIHIFMMRLGGLEVYECPKFLDRNPTVRHHYILLPNLQLLLLLCINGIISYLPKRRPDASHRLTHNTPE